MGGRIEQSIGEIVIPKRMSVSQTVRVDVLRKDPAHSSSIVVSLTSKAVLGASLVPFELTSNRHEPWLIYFQGLPIMAARSEAGSEVPLFQKRGVPPNHCMQPTPEPHPL